MHRPRLVILDEPTAGVDFELRTELWRYIRKLHDAGTTILLTTHYLEEAEALCEEIALIRDGRLIARDSAAGLLERYEADSLNDVYVKAMAGCFSQETEVVSAAVQLGKVDIFAVSGEVRGVARNTFGRGSDNGRRRADQSLCQSLVRDLPAAVQAWRSRPPVDPRWTAPCDPRPRLPQPARHRLPADARLDLRRRLTARAQPGAGRRPQVWRLRLAH
jgi:hypothetical protein